MFRNEIDALMHVQRSGGHPNIIQLLGAAQYPRALLVLEVCSSGTLKDALNLRLLSAAQLLEAYCSVARAVSFLHHLNPKVIHRSRTHKGKRSVRCSF